MNVYLVRHGYAKPPEEDPERSLTEQGRQDTQKVSIFMAMQARVKVDRILHSGRARAQQTAEILGQYLKPPEGVEAADGLDLLAEPSVWAERLADMSQDICLVGHLPHLSRLAALLLCGSEGHEVVKLERSGVICLSRSSAGGWAVRWMIIPQILS
jgi:phosphohistidine phosphatase